MAKNLGLGPSFVSFYTYAYARQAIIPSTIPGIEAHCYDPGHYVDLDWSPLVNYADKVDQWHIVDPPYQTPKLHNGRHCIRTF